MLSGVDVYIDVALEIQDILVQLPVVNTDVGASSIVIDKIHDMGGFTLCPCQADDLAVLGYEIVGYAVDGFLVTDAVQVIFIVGRTVITDGGGHLPSIVPAKPPAGAVVVADGISGFYIACNGVVGSIAVLYAIKRSNPLVIAIGTATLPEEIHIQNRGCYTTYFLSQPVWFSILH